MMSRCVLATVEESNISIQAEVVDVPEYRDHGRDPAAGGEEIILVGGNCPASIISSP